MSSRRAPPAFFNFDLLVSSEGDRYRVRVIGSPSGEAEDTFSPPFSREELERLTSRLELSRGRMRRMSSPQMAIAKEMGGRLYETAMTPAIRTSYARAVDEAERQGAAGIRIRLRLDAAPELAALPWEMLFDPDPRVGRFIALAEQTPLIRYLELPEMIRPLRVTPPIRILAVVTNPADDRYAELDVEGEWRRLEDEALKDQIADGSITVTRLPRGTLSALQQELLERDYHVLHYIGHGRFDEAHQDGLLVFEGERGGVNEVGAERFGLLLHNARSLRLAVINACEGGRAAVTDPYAGMAQTLVRMGVPAVVAMQFEISDRAAITFARHFYWSVARGRPVDVAITHARMAVFQQVNEVEWATPVLYLRAPDGRIFDVAAVPARRSRPALTPVTLAAVAPPSPAVPLAPTPTPVLVHVAPTISASSRGSTPASPIAIVARLRRAGSVLAGSLFRIGRLPTLWTSQLKLRRPVAGVAILVLTTAALVVGYTRLREDPVIVGSADVRPSQSIPSGTSSSVPTAQPSESQAPAVTTSTPTAPPTASPTTAVTSPPTPAPRTAPPATAPPATTAPPPTIPPPTAPPPSTAPTGTSAAHGSVKWNTSPIDGITVELRRTSDYSIIATTKADVNGVFRFANVPADTYTTSLVIPSGSQFQGWITPGYKTVAAGAEIDLGTTQVMKILTGLSPNGATVTLPQTLYWSPVPEASYYYIEIYEGPTITGQAFLTATVNIAQYTLSSVRADKRYAWAVYAIAQPSVYLARGTATFQIP